MTAKRVYVFTVVFMLSCNAFAASDCVSGEENCWECGTNCTARFNPDTKTFNVSGTGKMADLATDGQARNVPWYSIRQSVEHITFDGAITSINTFDFYQMNATNVTIPDSVTDIGLGFYNTSSLKHVTIPNSVTSIGYGAFYNTSLESVVIPDSVTKIGNAAFAGNTNLVSVVIGNQTQISETSFSNANENLKIYCTGNLTQCQANAGVYADKVVQASTKKINGVTYIFDNKGRLCATSGIRQNKRIYTIEEASLVSGTKNSVMIRYK